MKGVRSMKVDRIGINSKNRRLTLAICVAVLTGSPAMASVTDVSTNGLSGTYLAARSADSDKDLERAAFFYREVLERDTDNPFVLDRALILTAATDELDVAVPLAEQVIELAPDSRVGRLVLAVDAIRGRAYKQTLANVDASGSGVLADLTGGLIASWALVGQGEVDQALTRIANLEGEIWYEPFKLLHSGHVALASGRKDIALGQFRQAFERDRNAIRITEAYARALALSDRREEAIDIIDDFLLRFPGNPLAQQLLDDLNSGETVSASVRTPSEGVAEVLSGIGAAIGEEGGVEIAALYLRLALQLEPQIAGGLASLSLGNLLAANDQHEAAISVFESVDPEQPLRSLAFLRAAMSLDDLDRSDEAEIAFIEASDRSPGDFQVYLTHANMLRGRERFEEAANLYSKAINLIENPRRIHWTIYYFRGIAYERTQQWEKAEADFKKALDLSPDQPAVLNYLGYSWVDMGVNLEPALDMIRKAVELRPSDGYIVDSLGWAYYRLGRFDEAVIELERAVSLMPGDPVVNDHLGDAYWQVGRTLEAQFQWRHARDLGPDDEDLVIIVQKIDEGRLIEEDQFEKSEDGAFLQLQDEQKTTTEARVHIVKPGESLWKIAVEAFGDGRAYPAILDANSDVLVSPDDLAPGMQIIIPNL